MKKTNNILASFCVSLALCGCSESEINNEPESVEIAISPSVHKDSRGLDPITNLSLTNIGIYAGHTLPGAKFDINDIVANSALNNIKFTKDESGVWHGNPPQYWPLGGTLSLFAYTPYDASVVPSDDYTSGMLKVLFSPISGDVTYQTDFCTSKPVLNQKYSSSIPIEFGHRLSQIMFYANYDGSLPNPGFYLKIDKITLKNIIGTKYLVYKAEDPYFEWSDDAMFSGDQYRAEYSITRGSSQQIADNKLPKISDNPDGVQLTMVNGRLYLLPQKISGENILEFSYSWNFLSGSNETKIAQFAEIVNLPESIWTPSKVVKYIISIHLGESSKINVTYEDGGWIEDWQDSGNTPPITDLI